MTDPRRTPPFYRYRVNFGNGQVHYEADRESCERFIREHGDGATFLEFQDPDTGDWFRAVRWVSK